MIKLTLTQLYKSRSYGDYLSPKKYIEPFLLNEVKLGKCPPIFYAGMSDAGRR